MVKHRSKPQGFISGVILVALALGATFTSLPGRVPGDTKLYLYLDPVRLMSDSLWSFDSRQFGGWVPHQNVGYLWPSGPFFAFFEALNIPDWVAHRLWITMILSVAGIGTVALARFLGLGRKSAFLSSIAYQFSPYVLPYISRTSALLLPWSLLPWLIFIALRYSRGRRRLDIALFAILIASSGGLNATALLMIAPGPIIWILYDQARQNTGVFSRMFTVAKFGLASLLASAWWLAGLLIQSRYGASVLSYSEALVSTSATSTAPEVLRGLGYWLFYDRGPVAPLTSASAPYQTSLLLIALGASIVCAGLYGISRSSNSRRPLAMMLFVGIVLSVGAHPLDETNLLFRPFGDNPTNAVSLALRSSTRAVPLIVLAIALGLGFAWKQLAYRIPGPKLVYAVAVICLIGQLPASVNGDLIDRFVSRPEDLPSSWTRAAEFLDERYEQGFTGSVLLVPGIESAAYRWGYPVDHVLPGLSRKPFLSRDWLPLGSPAVMDLLYALDDSFQNGTVDPDAIAPVARLLGADTVMFVTSTEYERFGTISPARAAAVFDPVPRGLRHMASFGPPERNVSAIPQWSEETVLFPTIDLPEIILFSVDDVPTPNRIAGVPVLGAVDGTGLVDLAASDAIHGSEFILAEAPLENDLINGVIASGAPLIVSDSMRDRAHHWRGSQEVWGATEPDAGVLEVRDVFDSRLPIGTLDPSRSETHIESAEVEATATAYGAELRYLPEFRPRAALDGDTRTAWRLSPDRDPRGHVLTLRSRKELNVLRLLQPLDEGRKQWITGVAIRVDGGSWTNVRLDRSSLEQPGQIVELTHPGKRVDIRIESLNRDDRFASSLGVGFAEVLDGHHVSPEIVVLPHRVVVPESTDIVYSLNRLRADPFDRWREDPESALVRRLPYAMPRVTDYDIEVSLDDLADDVVLASQFGVIRGISTERLHGSPRWWGPSAFDGDPSTSWRSPVSTDARAGELGTFHVPLERQPTWIEIEYASDSPTSTLEEIELALLNGDGTRSIQRHSVPAPDRANRVRIPVTGVSAKQMDIILTQIRPDQVVDAYTGQRIASPVAIAEIRSDAWENAPISGSFDTGCRSDVLTLDSEPVPLRIRGSVSDALRGEPLDVDLCSFGSLAISEGSLLRSTPGILTGWNIDRMRLSSSDAPLYDYPSENLMGSSTRQTLEFAVPPCSVPCVFETSVGFSTGWNGTLDGDNMGAPTRSAAGRNTWFASPSDTTRRFTATWLPQNSMWAGIGISSVTLFIALLVVARDSIRSRRVDANGKPRYSDRLDTDDPRSVSRIRLSISTLLIGLLTMSPFWGAGAALAIFMLYRRRISDLAISSVLLGYLFIVIQQIRLAPDPGFGWPSFFERAHQPMLGVILAFTMSAFIDRQNVEQRPT